MHPICDCGMKYNTSDLELMTIQEPFKLVTLLKKWYLWPVLNVLAIAVPLWSHDHDPSAQQLAQISDHHSFLWSYNHDW